MANVIDTYNKIAKEFDVGRYLTWGCFEKFINKIHKDKSIVEIGCGNGVNLLRLEELGYKYVSGCDLSSKLVEICLNKNLNVVEGDICNLQYADNSYDVTLCIAVLHHLSTVELKKCAIRELVRITKDNGLIFITVNSHFEWTKYVKINNNGDIMIKQWDCDLFYHLFEPEELTLLFDDFNDCSIYETYDNSHVVGIVDINKNKNNSNSNNAK